jgi:hypothetical protein
MFVSPYDTIALKSFNIQYTRETLLSERTQAHDIVDFYPVDWPEKDRRSVYAYISKKAEVPPFSHPMVFQSDDDDLPSSEYRGVIFDARGVAKFDERNETLNTTAEYEYAKLRSKIIYHAWMEHTQDDLRVIGEFGGEVFALLMAENVGRRMNLSEEQQRLLQIASAFYYLRLYEDIDFSAQTEALTDEEVLLDYARRVSRMTRNSVKDVMDLIRDQIAPYDLPSFIQFVQSSIEGVRLEKLTVGTLFTMLGGIWFNSNATEHVAVALEHPPTFMAMLYMAINHRGYQKTILAKVAERLDRRGDRQKELTKNIERLFE